MNILYQVTYLISYYCTFKVNLYFYKREIKGELLMDKRNENQNKIWM